MAKRTFLVDIDLTNNQLLQARFENLATDPTGVTGRVYYNTTINKIKYFNGTVWLALVNEDDLAGLGNSVTGGLINKGGYDANTNTPNLDVTPIAGIKNGWTYVITANGNFFAEAVQVGDMIIAKQDDPTTLAHWTTVNKNIPDIVNASETERGIIEISTTAEASAGTDDLTAITPLKLRQTLGTSATLSNSRKFSVLIGDGTATSIAVTHNLGNTSVVAQVSRVASPFDVIECEMVITSANVTTFNFNTAPTSGQYRVTIIG